jgi:predicted protein tyrosine phosphatase
MGDILSISIHRRHQQRLIGYFKPNLSHHSIECLDLNQNKEKNTGSKTQNKAIEL